MKKPGPVFTLVVVAVALLSVAAGAADSYTPGEPVRGDFKTFARSFLESHCFDCHDEDKPKGDLSLVDLGPVEETLSLIHI